MWERRMHESRRRTPEDLQRGGVCKMSRILRILYLCKKNGQKPECSSKAGGKSGLFEYLLHRKDLTLRNLRRRWMLTLGIWRRSPSVEPWKAWNQPWKIVRKSVLYWRDAKAGGQDSGWRRGGGWRRKIRNWEIVLTSIANNGLTRFSSKNYWINAKEAGGGQHSGWK